MTNLRVNMFREKWLPYLTSTAMIGQDMPLLVSTTRMDRELLDIFTVAMMKNLKPLKTLWRSWKILKKRAKTTGSTMNQNLEA